MDWIMFIWAVFVFIVSLCIGSFLNVLIYRLPNKISIIKPASHCPNCKHKIAWYDNIPLLSYLILKGKCRYCKTKISIRYFLVECFTAMIATLIFIRFGFTYESVFGILFFYVLVAITFIDIENYIIPDSLNLSIFIIGLIGLFFNSLNYGKGIVQIDIWSKLIAILVNLALIVIVSIVNRISKREVMGGGDLKLLLVVSLFLGWQLLLLSIMLASIIATIIELPKKYIQKKKNKTIDNVLAFGPYLSIAFIISYMYGINIIEWYLESFVF